MSGGSTMSAGGGTTTNNKKKSPASSFPLSSQVPVSSSQINHMYFMKPFFTSAVVTVCCGYVV